MSNTPPLPVYVRMAKAQTVFGLHRSTFYRLAEKNEINIYKRGACSFLKTSEIMAYIEGTALPA